ncbi:unnamed protein product [Dibothriocephalus latus]|uniref:Uncharacterized protein n=1 Tax=Dibothriocephalus latus TaxID=60516 RepID=A0A3P6QIH1_DIBLA|nr:unnamed protein product [Dibothriocephalus latus]
MRPNNLLLILCGFCLSVVGFYMIRTFLSPAIYSTTNKNRIAMKVRDEDERRLTVALSRIGHWKLLDRLPLSTRIFSRNDNKGKRAFDILTLVLTADRGRHRIDAFEPQYLTQTVVSLVDEIQTAPASDYPHFGSWRTAVCAGLLENETGSTYFNGELLRMRSVLGNQFVWLHHANRAFERCQPLLSLRACLSLSLKNIASRPDYVMLLEDDFLVSKQFLRICHEFLQRQATTFPRPALQLYLDTHVQPYDSQINALIVLLNAISGLPLLISCLFTYAPTCRRQTIRFYLFLVLCVPVICLLLTLLARGPTFFWGGNIINSPDPIATATGSAILLPVKVTFNLLDLSFTSTSCDEFSSKSSFLFDALNKSGTHIFSARIPAVHHIGMYSHNKHELLNPLLFPH